MLCGGQGERAGGADKPLLPFANGRLIDSVVQRIRPQVDELIISANRNQPVYAALPGVRQVVADQLSNYQGPLAGIAACLAVCRAPWILVCAGDVPLVPKTLCAQLWAARSEAHPAVAVAAGRQQHLHFLMHRNLRPVLEDYLTSGQRSAKGWHAQVATRQVPIKVASASEFDNWNHQK